jgi:hypothetical protein
VACDHVDTHFVLATVLFCACGAVGLPVFAVGNVAYDALAKLLLHLGAGPGGNTHVVVTDVREELVVYVNGEQGCTCVNETCCLEVALSRHAVQRVICRG